tara:strand:- start:124 stop:1068 length:945 start_codon:yes stop_codon:yes gene_type:complete
MAWWTIPAIAGGISFAVAKISGASTSDSLKSGFLSGIGAYATGAMGAGLNKAATESVLTETIKGQGGNLLQKGVSAAAAGSGSPIAAGMGVYGNAPLYAKPSFLTSAMGKAGDYLSDPSNQLKAGITLGQYSQLKGMQQTGASSTTDPYNLTPEERKALYDKEYNKLAGLSRTYDYSNDTPTTPSFMNTTPTFVNTQNMFSAKKGAFVEGIAQYATGGVNYLPSKIENDENDVNNYVRATGYVEDGSGVGDKDEDTMLAQLADGEFVSRADAILGAGIMAGANPEDFKDMRKKGAAFFYNQQDRLKRVYDLVNA